MTFPKGLTHPYDSVGPKATTFAHGYTFTWTRGERYVAVQRGRVANARRVKVYVDSHPGHEIILGRAPVVDWVRAPVPSGAWRRDSVLRELADRWLDAQRSKARQSA